MNEAMGDSDKLAFWGIALKPGVAADIDLEDGETLHVSMASFGVELGDKHGRSVVTATIRNSEDGEEPDKKYALSALTAGKTETVCMDVSFIGQESITFEVTGKNIVHLVGNFSFENELSDSESDDDDGSNLIGVYDDDDDEVSDEDSDDQMPRLIMDEDPPVITELPDDEDSSAKDKKAVVLKKKGASSSKVPNGKAPEPSSKKTGKAASSKASKESRKKPQKKMNVDEPLVADESEEEDESEDESVDESGDEDVAVAGKIGKNEKEAISDDDDDDDDSDMNDVEGDDSESEDEEDAIKGTDLSLQQRSGKKGKMAKPSVVFKETSPQNSKEDAKATPVSAKAKRQRKRGSVAGPSDGVTPPQNKKSKISERPGTPAPSKSASRTKTLADPASSSKSGGKKVKANAAGPSNGKKASSSSDTIPSTPEPTPKENESTPTAGGTTGKRRRRRRGRSSS